MASIHLCAAVVYDAFTTIKDETGAPDFPRSAREPQGAVGVIENPHLNGLDESVEVNVGGSGRAAKGSQSTDDIPARRRPHSRPRTGTPPPWRRGPGA